MPKVKVMVKNNQTEVRVPVGIRMLIRRCCQAVLVAEHFGQDAEVSVSFVSNDEIHRLNKIYRQKDRATDVLSFPWDRTVTMTPTRRPAAHCWAMWSSPWKWLSSRQICTVTPWSVRSAF